MRRLFPFAAAALAAQAIVFGQGADPGGILAAARAAMGGSTLAAITSLAATGRVVKFTTGAATDDTDFEMALQLPDKFFKKQVIAVLGDSTIYRTSGFDGDGLIDATDVPPGVFGGMSGQGRVMMRSADGVTTIGGPGAAGTPDPDASASRAAAVLANKQDFARLALGLFAASVSAYPLDFTRAPASPDPNLDAILVKGAGDFSATLFVDRATHLPAKITWMAKEPLTRTTSIRGGGTPSGGAVTAGGGFVSSGGQTMVQGGAMTPEERAQMMQDMAAQAKAADANRRIVEYQMAYGEFKTVAGVTMPTHFRRTIDGKATDELVLDKITINPKIDPSKFVIVK